MREYLEMTVNERIVMGYMADNKSTRKRVTKLYVDGIVDALGNIGTIKREEVEPTLRTLGQRGIVEIEAEEGRERVILTFRGVEWVRDRNDEKTIANTMHITNATAGMDALEAQEREENEMLNNKNQKKTAPKAATKKADTTKKERAPRKNNNLNEFGLTELQTTFMQHLADDDFWENGEQSTLWVPIYVETISGKMTAMQAGAMVSTLREKGLLVVGEDNSRGKKMKHFTLTEEGAAVWRKVTGATEKPKKATARRTPAKATPKTTKPKEGTTKTTRKAPAK